MRRWLPRSTRGFSTSVILDEQNPFIFNRSRYLPADRFIIMREPEDTHRVMLSLPDRKVSVELNPRETLASLKRSLLARPRRTKIHNVQFRSYDNQLMADSTPVSLLLTLPYYIVKVNAHTLYTVLNERNFALNNEKHRIEVEELPLYTHGITSLGMRSGTAKALAEFSNSLLQGFGDSDRTRDQIDLLLKEALVKRARQLRLQARYLKEHMVKLEAEEEALSNDYRVLASKAEQHAVRRARQFVGVFLLQFLMTQYGTYFMFSWDIMEPITCAMTLGDAVLGYLFWMWSKKGYEASTVHQYFYEGRLRRLMRREGFDYERYQMVRDSLRILKQRLYEIS